MLHKLLIIDDDEYIRDLYVEIFKEDGYQVESACDGEEGLTKMTNGQFDLVLLDIMMPKVDGIGLLRRLAALSVKPQVKKIVLLTNLVHDPIIQEGLSLGAASSLIKADYTPDLLLAKVRSFLDS